MSESVDFNVPPDGFGNCVIAANRFEKETDGKAEPNHCENLAGDKEDDEQSVPSDLLKPYYCGFGICRPKWLQVFAKKKFFTFLLCLFAFLQGSVVSGKLCIYKLVYAIKGRIISSL